jgi:hypothetical protein
MEMSKHTEYLKISSTDGKNVVESVINDLRKQASKGEVEFGINIQIERVEPPAELEDGFE